MAHMAEVIWLDAEGKEIRREPKRRGRPRKGSVLGSDGNFYVHPTRKVKKVFYYVLLDDAGNEMSRMPKGRGRNKPGFVKKDDGNWYGVAAREPDTEFTPVPESASV